MTTRNNRRSFLLAATLCTSSVLGMIAPALAAAPAPAPAAAASDDASTYKKLIDTVGPSLVTVKFMLKIEASGQMAEMFAGMPEEGIETEVTGFMIEKDGLVLLSNSQLGGYYGMYASRMGGSITPNPTDIKVLIGDDTEGLKAKFLTRDKDLDLAWIKITDPKAEGKAFSYVDLNSSATPTLGDRLLAVSRMGKYFDHALVVSEGKLGGNATKPRSLLIPVGFQRGEMGMPVFDAAGKTVGVHILQMPNRDDMEGADSSELMSGGGMAIMILPAADVAKATARGKELAAKNASEDDKKPAESSSDKPAEPAKDKPAP